MLAASTSSNLTARSYTTTTASVRRRRVADQFVPGSGEVFGEGRAGLRRERRGGLVPRMVDGQGHRGARSQLAHCVGGQIELQVVDCGGATGLGALAFSCGTAGDSIDVQDHLVLEAGELAEEAIARLPV